MVASLSGQGNDALMMFSRGSRVPGTEVDRGLAFTSTVRYVKTAYVKNIKTFGISRVCHSSGDGFGESGGPTVNIRSDD